MGRLVSEVIGHTNQVQKLKNLLTSKRWPHGMLFVGPSGIGKKKLALSFAQMLICPKFDENRQEACGNCGACLRVEKQQSESLIVIQPDPESSRPLIKVEAIRQILDSLSLASLNGPRVIIIDKADYLNDQASNALLKTLEEPFENVFFILIGADLDSFLPTIRSRIQTFRFNSLSNEEMKQLRPDLPDWMYHCARGQIDMLDRLCSDEGVEKREHAFLFFERFCLDSEFLNATDWRLQFKERSFAQFNIKCWLQLIRDLLILKTELTETIFAETILTESILNIDQHVRFKKLFSLSSKQLVFLADQLKQAELSLKANVESVLIFENMWVKYARMD